MEIHFKRRYSIYNYLPAIFVLLFGCLVSSVSYFMVSSREGKSIQQKFIKLAEELAENIMREIESELKTRQAGCTDYLSKPFLPADLVKTIQKYMD